MIANASLCKKDFAKGQQNATTVILAVNSNLAKEEGKVLENVSNTQERC